MTSNDSGMFSWNRSSKSQNSKRRSANGEQSLLNNQSSLNRSTPTIGTIKEEKDMTPKKSKSNGDGDGSKQHKSFNIRADSMGGGGHDEHNDNDSHSAIAGPKIDSLNYRGDESEAFRAYSATQHYKHRGEFWNEGKREIIVRYCILSCIGLVQGTVAHWCNYACHVCTEQKFGHVADIMANGNMLKAFITFWAYQISFAAWASLAVWIEPLSGGSGIPEVKCFLNGIDLPRLNDIQTGLCKVLGVIGSVAAGLPIGKEGPMVHSGAVVAAQLSRSAVKDDKARRDYVACGAAAGVCTAFSAPIGGILFALEEGASYWSESVTFRTFYTSAWSISTLYFWATFDAQFGKLGLGKLFSFGNFIFEGTSASYSVWDLLIFIFIGCFGGLIGAIFNNANERLTHWRIKHVNHTKSYRFLEVMIISTLVSIVGFGVPFFIRDCLDLPDGSTLNESQNELIDSLVQFDCPEGQFAPIASLFFNDGNDAIKLLFHMHSHTFPVLSLFLFFTCYLSLAAVTYGIAVPSGLFVPSLLAGAAFGRLLGNVIYIINPEGAAFSNTYSLIGAAAVLGGMARMTISLTVILLEATGNEQFALPLMISLFCARVVGSIFNADLYHIHIHLKKGVHFLDAELRSITGHHDLYAGHIMSKDVVFMRPIEKVGTIYDILLTCGHACFPVVDTDDRDILFGTVNRNVLTTLLQQRAYGMPSTKGPGMRRNSIVQSHGVTLQPNAKYVPLVPYKILEREYPGYTPIEDISVGQSDRDLYIDLRPYTNTAPHTVKETTSVSRAYDLFRSLGLRLLVVTNKYNQCVGTISRDDLLAEALAQDMITKGRKTA